MIKTFAFILYTFFADGTTVREIPDDLTGLTANECAFLLTLPYSVPTVQPRGVVKEAQVACEEEVEL